jgi:hypothetical protein
VREHQRIHDHFLGHLLRATLDHHDGVAAGADDQVQLGDIALGHGGVHDELAAYAPHAHAREGASPGNIRQVQRRRGAGHGQHVGEILAIGRQHHGDDLGVETPALGKQRPARPIDEPRGQHLDLGHAPFALEIAARDLAGRGRLF